MKIFQIQKSTQTNLNSQILVWCRYYWLVVGFLRVYVCVRVSVINDKRIEWDKHLWFDCVSLLVLCGQYDFYNSTNNKKEYKLYENIHLVNTLNYCDMCMSLFFFDLKQDETTNITFIRHVSAINFFFYYC